MVGLLVVKKMSKVDFKECLLTEITTSVIAVTVSASDNYFCLIITF